MHVLLLSLIGLAFVLIIIEDLIHLNKAKSTLFIGTLVWILAFVFPEHSVAHIKEGLNENLLDIATLWLFLMAAMTFVAYLNQQGLITQLVYRLLPNKLTLRTLMILMALMGLVFSSLADNITASLIMLSLLTSLKLDKKQTLKFATLIVFAVNSGGVSLITGDVTTLMIFLAGKVDITDLFLLIGPACAGVISLALLLMWGTNEEVTLPKFKRPIATVDKLIAVLFLLTIFSTLFMSVAFSVPPVLTFLFGLSVMFISHRLFHRSEKSPDILESVREIEFDTLLFFLGVLLLVGMLKELSVLEFLLQLYDILPTYLANFVVGILSALVDNVPLTAAILKSGISMSTAEWLGLTYAVGVGGSILIIGSAAGVIALSKLEEVSFITYLRFIHWLLLAYTLGYVSVMFIANL
ncbi:MULTISPECIES: sodium:proton antiporter NhaD [unclassified Neptuniibacter]|jgi:Na+/H+ antiporter NhaD/arsenite permease-like protein|uniref:sodium:proton antiporter NhaD n=1 Tax=unclassified Neptuniibacter TaxID=2630693 RepID=UPI0026E36E88|nr:MULTISPECIES: sodium:proton antiporter NhaD [unclassified Neptuniibacter]MDO6514106.1 sodium:proton antiporter NhaD [Neptuniibacter sp. 2_MG-2023]MDO6594057.1 sodium:proton antiporter NhaD [Neptuniibacter sp. 1_MG-2023]